MKKLESLISIYFLSVSGPFPLLYTEIQSRAYYHTIPRNSISDCSCPVPGVDGGKMVYQKPSKSREEFLLFPECSSSTAVQNLSVLDCGLMQPRVQTGKFMNDVS